MTGAIGRLAALLLLLASLLPAAPAAADTTGQDRMIERARIVLDALLDDPNYAQMRVYVQNAYAVMVVPDLLKGSFFIGAQHGVGVMVIRNPQTGGWGQPAFYDLYGGSLGLQFGGQSSEVVFTIMNQAAVDKVVNSGIKLGADAGVAIGRLGAGIGAATTVRFGEDIYVFAKSKGLFGGFSVDGTYIRAKDDWNAGYYGQPVRSHDILRDFGQPHSQDVAALRDALSRF
jgi:lipid-binding SYLF domain-containing protein